ncbi:CvpA family protein [Alicyclobacillus vulcanalis]|uniref:Colicin V production protein n=1 Tax=Alicyclobacillus vulcanalis TaxID=252246 RepID=A0A1N7PA19_9BACL|nr:CvpA family protein [Alicyclobacillus vulcanalis]SIT07366.1 Colicin V production protein [Alicyclobacillus vulcanalis]
MTWDALDLALAAILLLGALNGYRLGFVRQVMRLFGGIIAYLVSYWARPYVAPAIAHLGIPAGHVQSPFASFVFGNLSGAISFALVFLVVFVMLRYAAGLVDALFSLPVLSGLNRLAGLFAGFLLAGVFVYVIALVLPYVKSPAVERQVARSAICRTLDQRAFDRTVAGWLAAVFPSKAGRTQ